MNMEVDNKAKTGSHTISTKEIDYLANLGRIIVPEEEKEALAHELAAIVSYVDEISKVEIPVAKEGKEGEESKGAGQGVLIGNRLVAKNVMRKDEVTTEPGAYTRKLVDSAPRHEGDFIVVKKIIADSE